MPEWVSDLLTTMFFGPFYKAAEWIWNWVMGLCTGIITTSPQNFSADTWSFVADTLYPWSLAIGAACLNLFFIMGFLKAVSNFKENITLELCIESMVRLVAVNVLLHVGLPLIQTLFTMASQLAGQVFTIQAPEFFTGEQDTGSALFWWLFGFAYFVAAMVCAFLIFLTLYGRYIKLYLLTVLFPIAMPTLAGGRGLDESAKAWAKTFLSNVFEIVVIALTMAVASRIIGDAGLQQPGFAEYFDGFAQAMQSLVYMILMTSSVKGAAAFMNKALHL
ncbi:MAG: hypothetical protein HFH24_07785 [Ruminococcus sp.]|nr:hypothetical protein [Ruminococcus sp.]